MLEALHEDGWWFVGEKVSLADVAVFNLWEGLSAEEVNRHLTSYPKLHRNREKVRELLGHYLNSRPVTPI